jgi:hypothetical protein
MSAAKQTASADENARGFFKIMQGGELISAIWANDVMVINKSREMKDGAQISIRGGTGLWIHSTASVGEVYSALSTAKVLLAASSPRKRSA